MMGIISGFAVDALLAARLGFGDKTDAFFAANTVPFLISSAIAASLSSSLVPLLSRRLGQEKRIFWRYVSRVLFLVVLLGLCATVLLVFASGLVVRAVAPGFNGAKQQMAVRISRIMSLIILFDGASEVLNSVFYARRSFAIPSSGKLIVNGVLIIALMFLSRTFDIYALAVGHVIGRAGVLLFTGAMSLYKYQARLVLVLGYDAEVGEIARVSSAPLLASILRQLVLVAENIFSSYLPAGSLTAISYGNRLMTVVAGVFLSSVKRASMPSLAADLHAGRLESVKRTIRNSFSLIALLAIPLSIGVMVLGVPLIRVFFFRGAFSREDVVLTGTVLSIYAISIPFLGYFRVTQAYFYAATRVRSVILLFGLLTAANIGLDFVFVPLLGVYGLPLSFAVSALIVAVVAMLLLRHSVSTLGLKQVGLDSLRVAISGVVMGGAILLLNQGLPSTWWALAITVGGGGVIFVLTANLLRVAEFRMAYSWMRKRIRSKSKREA